MKRVLRTSPTKAFLIWLIVSVSALQSLCFGAAEVTLKTSELDFIQNLISDIDALTPVKKFDNYDFAKELSASFRLNTIYNAKQINIGVSKAVLEDKCNELMNLKGAGFASQLSLIIHDAIKVAFSKEFDPMGLGTKQGVMKAESEIPRSSFQITYSFKYDNSIADLVDFLYTARTETAIQRKYSILVEFIADLVNVAKMRRSIEITDDTVQLNKLAFGSNVQPAAQTAKKPEAREKKPPVPAQAKPVQSSAVAVTPKATPGSPAPVPAADTVKKDSIQTLAPPDTLLPAAIIAEPPAKAPSKPVKDSPDELRTKTPQTAEAPKKMELPPEAITAKPLPVAQEKPAAVKPDNDRPVAIAVSGTPATDIPSPERRLSFAIKPKSAYAGIDDCVQANIGAAVSLSAGYGTMDVLKITRYLCEGIFLAKPGSSSEYSGYESCVEKNLANGSDGFSMLKNALGFCDKEFGIREK